MGRHQDDREEPPEDHVGLERLVFFSDAVFAIAITLLALEIRLPAGEYADDAALAAALLGLWPKLLSYAISFLVIGGYWLAHHRMFRTVTHYDRRLLFLNLLLLMGIAFVPFPTGLLGESAGRVATIVYAMTIVITGAVNALVWWHVNAGGRLVERPLQPRELRRGLLRALTTPLIFLLSVPLAWVASDLARYSWALIAPAMMLQASGGRPARRAPQRPAPARRRA